MTTRSKQRISSLLAVVSIIGLLLLLVFLWSAVGNGVFSNENKIDAAHRPIRLHGIDSNDTIDKQIPSTQIHSTNHGHHSHHQHHRHHESTIGKKVSLFFCF